PPARRRRGTRSPRAGGAEPSRHSPTPSARPSWTASSIRRTPRPCPAPGERSGKAIDGREPGPSRQRPQRADRGGLALLHEIPVDDGVSLRVAPRPAPGAWGEQATAPDGQAPRLL